MYHHPHPRRVWEIKSTDSSSWWWWWYHHWYVHRNDNKSDCSYNTDDDDSDECEDGWYWNAEESYVDGGASSSLRGT